MKKVGIWLLLAGGVLVVLVLCLWAGAEWSEAIVQGAAAIGGLLYWDYRARPRVTLRILSGNGLYLEFVNVGNRVAKHVRGPLRTSYPVGDQVDDTGGSVRTG